MTGHPLLIESPTPQIMTGLAGECLNDLDIVYAVLDHSYIKMKRDSSSPYIISSEYDSFPGNMIQLILIEPGMEHYAKTRSDPQLYETLISTGNGRLTTVGDDYSDYNNYGEERFIKVEYFGGGRWTSLEDHNVREDIQICSICQYFAIKYGLIELKTDEYKLIL